MPTLLLVEDDAELAVLTATFLRGHGYDVAVEGRGDAAVERILTERPELVLLDLLLPGMHGTEVCRRARDGGYVGGVVMLTALGEASDEVLGLGVGADDYLVKPIRPTVLLARVQALMRRIQPIEPAADLGRLRLDFVSRTVELDGEMVPLTTADFDLLATFARVPGTVFSRDQLSLQLRGFPWDGLDRSVDLRVSRLRRRLGDEDALWIKSVRGSGYMLVPVI